MLFSIIKIKALLVCSVLGIATLLVAACTVSAQGPKLIYGQQYRIQDGYNNWSGGYLDTNNFCSSRWPGASLCVSTSQSPDRAGMHTATWTIRSASGKRDGDVVRVGDWVYLHNEYTGKTADTSIPTTPAARATICACQRRPVPTGLDNERAPG
jgi:hypothetical protein